MNINRSSRRCVVHIDVRDRQNGISAKRKQFNHAACTVAGANLASRAAVAEANRIQMCRQSEQKLLNNVPSVVPLAHELYTTHNDAVTARSVHFTTALLGKSFNIVIFEYRVYCQCVHEPYWTQTAIGSVLGSGCRHVPSASPPRVG